MQHIQSPKDQDTILFFLLMWIQRSAKQDYYCPPGLLSWEVKWFKWVTSAMSNTKWLQTKATVIVLHEKTLRSVVPLEHLIWFLISLCGVTEADVWCVNKITEPKQNKTVLSWDPSDQHVLLIWTLPASQGLSFTFTQVLPCRKKIRAHFSPVKLWWKSWWLS